MQLNVKFFDPSLNVNKDLFIPKKASKGSAGYDIFSPYSFTVTRLANVDLKIGFDIPRGYYGKLCDKTSIAKRGLKLRCSIVDSDYKGSIRALFVNNSMIPVTVIRGEPLVQIIFAKHIDFKVNLVSEFTSHTKKETVSAIPSTSNYQPQSANDIINQFESIADPDDLLFTHIDLDDISSTKNKSYIKCCSSKK